MKIKYLDKLEFERGDKVPCLIALQIIQQGGWAKPIGWNGLSNFNNEYHVGRKSNGEYGQITDIGAWIPLLFCDETIFGDWEVIKIPGEPLVQVSERKMKYEL